MRRLIVLVLGVLFISGCLMRTYTVYRPRKYTEVTGNQGCLMGTCKQESRQTRLREVRPMTIFEFEMGARSSRRQAKAAPAEVPQMLQQPVDLGDIDEEISKEEVLCPEDEAGDQEQAYSTYKILKGDTLQKISKKFYGTTRKWQIIYEFNKKVIK